MYNKKKGIVTVINSISETSMPYNEFVLYRHNFKQYDKQFLIVCCNSLPADIKIPEGLKVFCVGNYAKTISKVMQEIEKECHREDRELVVHLHQPKSALLFNIRTFFNSYRKKTIFTIHSLFGAYNIFNRFSSVFTSLLVGKVICVSEASYNQYPLLIKKIKKNNIMVLKNGVDLKRIDSIMNTSRSEKGEEKTLIYIARMIPIKNHKFLLKVFSQLSNCKLVLIGAEDKSGELRRLVEEEGLSDRVEMTGLIPRDEVFKRLRQADLYVSPSLIEGLPISVLEAMYVGLPVVISDIPPHLEIGIHCESVVTVPLNENKWVDTFNKYLRMNDSILGQVGANCRNCAQEYFSLDSMLEKYDEIYEIMGKD